MSNSGKKTSKPPLPPKPQCSNQSEAPKSFKMDSTSKKDSSILKCINNKTTESDSGGETCCVPIGKAFKNKAKEGKKTPPQKPPKPSPEVIEQARKRALEMSQKNECSLLETFKNRNGADDIIYADADGTESSIDYKEDDVSSMVMMDLKISHESPTLNDHITKDGEMVDTVEAKDAFSQHSNSTYVAHEKLYKKDVTSQASNSTYHTADPGTSVHESLGESSLILAGEWDQLSSCATSNPISPKKSQSPICHIQISKSTSKYDSLPQSLDEKMQYFYEKLVTSEIEESIKDIYSNIQPPKLPAKPPRMKGSPIFITPLSELPRDLFPSPKLKRKGFINLKGKEQPFQEKASQTMLTAIVKNPYLDSMPNVYQTLIIKPRSPPPRPPPPNWSNLPKLKPSTVVPKATKAQPPPQRPPRIRRRSRTVEVIYPPERTYRKRSCSLNVINASNEPITDPKSLYTSVNKEKDKNVILDSVQMRPLPAPPAPPRSRLKSASSISSPRIPSSPTKQFANEEIKIFDTSSPSMPKEISSQTNLPLAASNHYSIPRSCAIPDPAPLSTFPSHTAVQETCKNYDTPYDAGKGKSSINEDKLTEVKFISPDSFSEHSSATSYFVYSHSLFKADSSPSHENLGSGISNQLEQRTADINNETSLQISSSNLIFDDQAIIDTTHLKNTESMLNDGKALFKEKDSYLELMSNAQPLAAPNAENFELVSDKKTDQSLKPYEEKKELEEGKGIPFNSSESGGTIEPFENFYKIPEFTCQNSDTLAENISESGKREMDSSLNDAIKSQDASVALLAEIDKTIKDSDKELSCIDLSFPKEKTTQQQFTQVFSKSPIEMYEDNIQNEKVVEKETSDSIGSNNEHASLLEKENLNLQDTVKKESSETEINKIIEMDASLKDKIITQDTSVAFLAEVDKTIKDSDKEPSCADLSSSKDKTKQQKLTETFIKSPSEMYEGYIQNEKNIEKETSDAIGSNNELASLPEEKNLSSVNILEKENSEIEINKTTLESPNETGGEIFEHDEPVTFQKNGLNSPIKIENQTSNIGLEAPPVFSHPSENKCSYMQERNIDQKINTQLDENANVPYELPKSKSMSPELSMKRHSSIKRISRSIFYDEEPHSPSPSCSHKSWNSESDISCGDLGDDPAGSLRFSKSIKLRTKNENPPHNKERRSSEFYCELKDGDYIFESPKLEKDPSPQECTDKSNTSSATTSSYSEMSLSSDESEEESFLLTEEDKKQRKIYYIAREIMTSEAKFVDVLRLLNVDFRSIIEKANKDSNVLPEEYVNKLFAHLPQLHKLNENLLLEFKDRIKNWKEHKKISDVIVKIGPFLKLYSSYIKDFDLLYYSFDDACKKYPYFYSLVKDFEQSPRCQKLRLKHFMLKPIQRIPQYKLLLQQYLENLQEDSPDYEDTKIALDVVSNVAGHADAIIAKGDNFRKMLSIQNSIIGQPEIVKPGREFIKEGELWKLSRKGEQPRRFILFNDILVYLTQTQNLYKINHIIPLAGMKVDVKVQHENEFCIYSRARSIQLAAHSKEEQASWVSALTKAIEENASKRSTFIMPSKESAESSSASSGQLGMVAPVWIPDARVTMCQVCTSEFSLAFRRHHCRACGKVVCALCSSNKAPLPYLQNQFSRVCDECYPKLCHDQPVPSPLPSSQQSQKRPRVLREVCANDQGSTISGYLYRFDTKRSVWKHLWFVIKNKVLYTYKASEDVAALESMPLLGFTVETFNESFQGIEASLLFRILQATVIITFHTTSKENVSRWVKALSEAAVLE